MSNKLTKDIWVKKSKIGITEEQIRIKLECWCWQLSQAQQSWVGCNWVRCYFPESESVSTIGPRMQQNPIASDATLVGSSADVVNHNLYKGLYALGLEASTYLNIKLDSMPKI